VTTRIFLQPAEDRQDLPLSEYVFFLAANSSNPEESRDAQDNQRLIRGGIHQLVIKTLSGFRHVCQQLAYFAFNRIFLIASKILKLFGSYQEYSAKSVGKQGKAFLVAALV
jgi:hypothetical protein